MITAAAQPTSLLVTRKQLLKWRAHYESMLARNLQVGRNPTVIDECEQHIAMIDLALRVKR